MSKAEYVGAKMLDPRKDYHEELPPEEPGVKAMVTTTRTRHGIQIVTSNMSPKTKSNNLPNKANR